MFRETYAKTDLFLIMFLELNLMLNCFEFLSQHLISFKELISNLIESKFEIKEVQNILTSN